MFGLFKKKGKVVTEVGPSDVNVEDLSKKKDKNKKDKTKYEPQFPTPDEFEHLYCKQPSDLVIGMIGKREIGLSLEEDVCKKILFINDDAASTDKQIIYPIINQGKLSYVCYDPKGCRYGVTHKRLEELGYDVQLVNLSDENNVARIDLFELVNITRSTYWQAVIFASSMKCKEREILPARNLFMSLMQYILETSQKVTIEELSDLFYKIKNHDPKSENMLSQCPASQETFMEYLETDKIIRECVCEKAESFILKPALVKCSSPNIYTITVQKKHTAIFIKKVTKEDQFITTTLFFNIKAASALDENGQINTLFIKQTDEPWMNTKLLNYIFSQAGDVMNRGMASVLILPNLPERYPIENNYILIYMSAADEYTRKQILKAITVENLLTSEKKKELSRKMFKNKEIPDDVLTDTPVSFEELSDFQKCIVIDTTNSARPFCCEKI